MYVNVRCVLCGCGISSFILGLLVTLLWKQLYYNIFDKDLKLVEGSQNHKVWSENSVPIYCKIYMFNWTNPEETLAKAEKANFTEMGPYTFRFVHKKSAVIWNKNNTVTFRADRFWNFVPEKSNGSLSDKVTNINAVAVSVGDRVKEYGMGKHVVNQILRLMERQVYVTKSVEELLFEGYRDQLLSTINTFKKLGINTGSLPAKFGWYFNKNATDENFFNIHTGADNLNLLGRVHSLNYNTEYGVYSAHCDHVQGSLGDLWPKNTGKKETVSVLVPDFCGSIDLSRAGVGEWNGIDGVRFVGTEKTFDNGVVYSENRCYSKDANFSILSGVRDISDCVHGPIFFSFPHFHLADEKYRLDINGMKPVADKHEFSITVHRELGMLMEIFGRLQINVKVEPYPGLGFFSDLPKIMVPTLWFDQYIEIPEDVKDLMVLALCVGPTAISAFGYVLIVVGVVLSIIGYFFIKQDRESESLNKLIF